MSFPDSSFLSSFALPVCLTSIDSDWIIGLMLIPDMDRDADRRYVAGRKSYNVRWVLLTFLRMFGLHRFYRSCRFSD